MKRAAGLVALLACAACRTAPPAAPPGPPPVPLHLEPACDLAPAAGLSWVAAIEPRTIAEVPDLIPAIATVLDEERLRLFATAHGGIDLRQVKELCVAQYPGSLLAVARVPLDPERVARAFDDRSGRPAVRTTLAPNPHVLRFTGDVEGTPHALLLFGRDAAAMEEGKSGPLRAAEAFAFGKLKRASPALRSSALSGTDARLEGAPVRVLVPGPFTGASAGGLGGLLRATTAVGGSARWAGKGSAIALRLVLTGAWGTDAPAAGERLAAALHVLSESVAGRLFGIAHPLEGPRVTTDPDALTVDAVVDGDLLARGVHDAVDAEVNEIMRR